jgi:hypothetical protein
MTDYYLGAFGDALPLWEPLERGALPPSPGSITYGSSVPTWSVIPTTIPRPVPVSPPRQPVPAPITYGPAPTPTYTLRPTVTPLPSRPGLRRGVVPAAHGGGYAERPVARPWWAVWFERLWHPTAPIHYRGIGALGDDWWDDPGPSPSDEGGGYVYTAPDYQEPTYPVEERTPPHEVSYDYVWPGDAGEPPHEIVRPGVAEAMAQTEPWPEYTQTQLEQAAATIVDQARAGTGWDAIGRAATTAFTGLVGIAPALLKGLFPAGIPPAWTPCPSGTYFLGGRCLPSSQRSCPEGTSWTGSSCERTGFRWPWEGGGGEGGGEGGFGEFAQYPMTAQWWFWPAILGGGVLVLIVSTRRR